MIQVAPLTWTQALLICVPIWVWILVSWLMWRNTRSKWREQDRKWHESRMEEIRKIFEERREKVPGELEIRRDRFERN